MIRYEPKLPPFKHQMLALERGWDKSGYAFLMEMGCGKSKTFIDNACMLRENKGLKRIFIVAPKGVYENWLRKEIPEHMPDRHREGSIIHMWRGGHSAAEKAALKRVMSDGPGLRVLIMNTEAISQSSKAYGVAEEYCKKPGTLMGVDESSTAKNPQAIRTKRLIKLGRLAEWRRIMTGTPNPRSPLDLWSQFEILGKAMLGFKSFFSFRSRFAIMSSQNFGGRSIDIVVGYRNTDLLSQIMEQHSIIVKKEDALDLPPKVYETRDVELTPEQKRMYSELKEFATAEINAEQHITATHVMTQILRLHQLVCGHTTTETGEQVRIPSNRINVLKEVVSEIDGKCIVWCNYRQDIDDVCEALAKEGYRVGRYDGGTSQEDRQKAVFQFQGAMEGRTCPEDEQIDVFVGTPHAAGYGITLTAARGVVYYSNTYDLEKRQQSEDRAHRIGQTRSVTYVDLIARGTVDENIAQALARKETLANIILDGPARVRNFFGG